MIAMRYSSKGPHPYQLYNAHLCTTKASKDTRFYQ